MQRTSVCWVSWGRARPSQPSSNPKRKNPWVVSDWCAPSADEQSEEAVAESTGFCEQVEFQAHHLPLGYAEPRLLAVLISPYCIEQSIWYRPHRVILA